MSPVLPSQVTLARGLLARSGLVCLVAGAALAVFWPAAILPAYRLALFVLLGPPIGSLCYLLIHRCTGGSWARPLIPLLTATGNLAPWIWLGVAPLLFLAPSAGADGLGWAGRTMLALRALVYAVILFGIARALARSQAAWVGPAGLIALVFMFHLLSDDWLVSLDPGWNSTGFSLIWLTGQAVTGLAWAIAAALLSGISPGLAVSTPERAIGIDWGNLLLTTALFWCYVMFAQFLIIWSAGLPRETIWYAHRTQGAWLAVPVLFALLEFAAPLLLLLSRHHKRTPGTLGLAAGLLMIGQFGFAAWVILPAFESGLAWSGIATGGFLAAGALALALRGTLVGPAGTPNRP